MFSINVLNIGLFPLVDNDGHNTVVSVRIVSYVHEKGTNIRNGTRDTQLSSNEPIEYTDEHSVDKLVHYEIDISMSSTLRERKVLAKFCLVVN